MQHPAAKSMIEISRTQDEEVGDGTTSVIILGKLCLDINPFAPEPPVTARADPGPFYPLWYHQF